MALNSAWGIHFHLHAMLVCIAAGFLIQNYSPNGDIFMEKIDHASLPIYVVFFAHVGADLDIRTLEHTWLIAILIVVVRFLTIGAGSIVGGKMAGDPPLMYRWSGPTFITQAGVSLGLAGIVKARFADWGAAAATMIIAVITINQVLGPITMKMGLSAVGETREARQRKAAGDGATGA